TARYRRWIDVSRVAQRPPRVLVDGASPRLVHRTFGPSNAEPREIFDRLSHPFLAAAKWIEVFDPEDDRPARGFSATPRFDQRARVADVHVARRRRRDAPSIRAVSARHLNVIDPPSPCTESWPPI